MAGRSGKILMLTGFFSFCLHIPGYIELPKSTYNSTKSPINRDKVSDWSGEGGGVKPWALNYINYGVPITFSKRGKRSTTPYSAI